MVGRTPRSAADPLVGLFVIRKLLTKRTKRDAGVPRGPGVRPRRSGELPTVGN